MSDNAEDEVVYATDAGYEIDFEVAKPPAMIREFQPLKDNLWRKKFQQYMIQKVDQIADESEQAIQGAIQAVETNLSTEQTRETTQGKDYLNDQAVGDKALVNSAKIESRYGDADRVIKKALTAGKTSVANKTAKDNVQERGREAVNRLKQMGALKR